MYWPKNKAQTVLTVLMSVAFLITGMMKLMGLEMVKEDFEGWGFPYPILFMRLIGLCEVAGAIGLWLPRFSYAAKICFMILMAGAVLTHGFHRDPVPKALGAIILLIFTLVTLMLHRKERDTNDDLMPAS